MHHIPEHRDTLRQAYWCDEVGHACQPFKVSMGSTDTKIGSSFQQLKNSVFPENSDFGPLKCSGLAIILMISTF